MRFSFNDLKLPDAVLAAWQRLLASRIGQRVAALPWWHRWPTRREWLLFAAALPLLFALYVLALIPFTPGIREDRKSTRLNSSHLVISYAVFCLKKKTPRRSSPQPQT